MSKKKTPRTLAFVAALAACQAAGAAEPPTGWHTDLRLGLGFFGEGKRDLGLGGADETSEGFADVQGTLYWNDGKDWAALMRAQGFVPTDAVTVTDEDQPRSSEEYARLRELWVEYNGFTSYPGEILRIGLQRLRDEDGLWFDTNIESVRWIYDTTLLQGHLGVAQSFLTYRSDDSTPVANVRDRTYVFGALGTQWSAGHYVGARAIHSFDHGVDFEEEQVDPDTRNDPKRSERDLTWVDVYLHNGYYERREQPGLAYWADASFLFGQREDFTPSPDGGITPASTEDRDVRAWAGELGLRYRLDSVVPTQLGVAYAMGSGSDDGDTEHRYEQTGLHSNRSRFAGTRTQAYRFNGAYQADLTNLQAASAYLSFPGQRWETALIYTQFMRHRAGEPVVTDGIGVQPSEDSRDLGGGLDLVLAYYFTNPIGRGVASVTPQPDDDSTRSNVRLRASGFDPGDAYADGADPQYALRAELTLWF